MTGGISLFAQMHISQLWNSPNDQVGTWPHLAPGILSPGLFALLTLE